MTFLAFRMWISVLLTSSWLILLLQFLIFSFHLIAPTSFSFHPFSLAFYPHNLFSNTLSTNPDTFSLAFTADGPVIIFSLLQRK